LSPGDSVLQIAASQPPVPLAGKVNQKNYDIYLEYMSYSELRL
jgi:hypothetical protein